MAMTIVIDSNRKNDIDSNDIESNNIDSDNNLDSNNNAM